MAPATIQPISETAAPAKFELRAPEIVLAVDHTASSAPSSSNGKLKTATPPRINPEGAQPIFFSGKDGSGLLAQILKMMQAVQEAEADITQGMAEIDRLMGCLSNEYLSVITTSGNAMIQKMEEARQAAEEAKSDSSASWACAICVGIFGAIATAATFGAAAGFFALGMAVMMALPSEDNPIDMGQSHLSSAMGGGTWADFGSKLVTIAAMACLVFAAGGGVGFFAEESSEEAADDAAEKGSSSFTKETIAKTTQSIAVDAGVQTTLMVNPLSDLFTEIAKSTGHENDLTGVMLQAVSSLLTAVLVFLAMRYGTPEMTEGMGMKALSKDTASTITKWSLRFAAAAAVMSNSFTIAAGVAKEAQADLMKAEAFFQRIYSTMQSLIKLLQSAMQQNEKQQQTITQSFQQIGGNFAHLADPFKFIADASQVLA
jgi:hypothetical protein